MPPKNKGKKAKKGDDDFWYVQHESGSSISNFSRDNAGESVTPSLSAPADGGGSEGEDLFAKKPKAGFSAFASAGLMDEITAEDDDDGGGLMVNLSAWLAH